MSRKRPSARLHNGEIVIAKDGKAAVLLLEAIALVYPFNGKLIAMEDDSENCELIVRMHNAAAHEQQAIVTYINDNA